MGLGRCYYCGDGAGGVDHAIPRVVLVRTREGDAAERGEASGIRRLTVPCCRQCNAILGLKIPDWREKELALLGPEMRKYVEDGIRARDAALERLRW